jgi:transposase
MVESVRLSNGKRKERGNRKCGNRYLCWAFMEAANYAVRFHPSIRRWYERKHRVVAIKVGSTRRAPLVDYADGRRPEWGVASSQSL